MLSIRCRIPDREHFHWQHSNRKQDRHKQLAADRLKRLTVFLFALFSCTLVLFFETVSQAAETDGNVTEKNTAASAAIENIVIETGAPGSDSFILAGRDSQQQLIVTGQIKAEQNSATQHSAGKYLDLTRVAQYLVEPKEVVSVSNTGLAKPLQEGEAIIKVEHKGVPAALIKVIVKNLINDVPVNFVNDVVPIFTKQGCNSGACHGKMSGQNGFRLSLLGFEPSEDYEHIVKEARGRRISPAAPEQSLLLLKSTGTMPHGGGPRIESDSPGFRMICRWIEQGVPYGKADDPAVTHITLFPEERTLKIKSDQQLICTAHYSDGSTRDVTNMTQFDANEPEMASCSTNGLVKTSDLSGAVAIMARFQGKVAVFRALVPVNSVKGNQSSEIPKLPDYANVPTAKNFIDELVLKQWKLLGLAPSDLCDDATFIRRVTIDIAGRLPTLEETKTFVANTDSNKRDKLIEAILNSEDYANYFANKWNALLRNKRQQEVQRRGTYLFHDWIRENLMNNSPYDQFVREIVTASGEMNDNPAVAWYRDLREAKQQEEDVAQLFLGMRIQCANCHHHPYEKWSQKDYYGLNAFFSRVGRKQAIQSGEEKIYHQRGLASATNPKTGKSVQPTGLDSKPVELNSESDPRHALMDWMASPENPFFAKALANRYWKHFFSRGLIEPEDDMRITNPPSNPELLDALAKSFIESKFDLKKLICTICSSNVYQLSTEPNEWNATDKQSYSRFYPKRLNAEVLLDSIDVVTGVKTKFPGYPRETTAVQLPDAAAETYFLKVFGKPAGSSACECERNNESSLPQCLHLINSAEMNSKITANTGRAAKMANDKLLNTEQKLEQLYLLSFSRKPTEQEHATAKEYLEHAKNGRQSWEDLIWVMVNTKEFMFNH